MKELTHDEMKSAGWMLIGIAVIASFFGYVWPLFFLVPWGLFMFWEGHKAKKKYLEGLGLKDSSKPIKPPVPQRFVHWCEKTAGALFTRLQKAR